MIFSPAPQGRSLALQPWAIRRNPVGIQELSINSLLHMVGFSPFWETRIISRRLRFLGSRCCGSARGCRGLAWVRESKAESNLLLPPSLHSSPNMAFFEPLRPLFSSDRTQLLGLRGERLRAEGEDMMLSKRSRWDATPLGLMGIFRGDVCLFNPNGIASRSPGLHHECGATLGMFAQKTSNQPQRGCVLCVSMV